MFTTTSRLVKKYSSRKFKAYTDIVKHLSNKINTVQNLNSSKVISINLISKFKLKYKK